MLIKRIVSVVARLLALIVLFAAILATIFYMQCPVYDMADAVPFSGSSIFNPYQKLDPKLWKKANFHTHTVASDGKNTLKEVQTAFRDYGYDILAISDHSLIINQGLKSDYEIPAYEHGINISKYHAVIIGARHGSIFDYELFNFPSQKYDAFRRHHKRGDVVIFDHPDRTRWLTPDDFKYISWYNFMEVQKGSDKGELIYFDEALSNGHYSLAMASDDCHDIGDMKRFGRAATFVNTPSGRYSDVKKALLHGYTFAVNIPAFEERMEYKLQRHQSLPILQSLKISNDTVSVVVSEPATIRAFGQDGVVKGESKQVVKASFAFTPKDTYLRFVALFPDGVMLFTNPLIRFNGKSIPFQVVASINYPLTVLYVVCCLAVLVLLVWLFVRVLRGLVWWRRNRLVTATFDKSTGKSAPDE